MILHWIVSSPGYTNVVGPVVSVADVFVAVALIVVGTYLMKLLLLLTGCCALRPVGLVLRGSVCLLGLGHVRMIQASWPRPVREVPHGGRTNVPSHKLERHCDSSFSFFQVGVGQGSPDSPLSLPNPIFTDQRYKQTFLKLFSVISIMHSITR